MPDILRIIEILIGVGLVIVVHELGHFLAAKWAGVQVDEFAIGMGPRLLSYKRGETRYSLRMIPIGGFVAMAGEEPGSETEVPLERQFRGQPPGKKAVIAVAGVTMNLILGVFLFALALGIGVNFVEPTIGSVEPGSGADEAGLHAGDRIIGINGAEDIDWVDVFIEVLMGDLEDPVQLQVLRGGKKLNFSVKTQPSADPRFMGLPTLGVTVATGKTVTQVTKDGPADKTGLKLRDKVIAVDGMEFLNWDNARYYMGSRMGEEVELKVMRPSGDGEGDTETAMTLKLVPEPTIGGTIGITPRTFSVVKKVTKDMPADKAGIKPGDEIRAIDGIPTPTFASLISLTAPSAGKKLKYTVRRTVDDKTTDIDVFITPVAKPNERLGRIGVAPERVSDFVVGSVEAGSPAAKLLIKPGDVISAVAGTKLTKHTWGYLQAVIDAAAKEEEILLSWRSGEAEWRDKKVKVLSKPNEQVCDIGFLVSRTRPRFRQYPFWQSIGVGFNKSWHMLQHIWLFFRGLITGKMPFNLVAGPLGIAHISYKITAQGTTKFIMFLAMICVNLAVVNLLPLLPFDGGILVVAGLHKVTGKPLSEKLQGYLAVTGWMLVITLLIAVTYNDIIRWFS